MSTSHNEDISDFSSEEMAIASITSDYIYNSDDNIDNDDNDDNVREEVDEHEDLHEDEDEDLQEDTHQQLENSAITAPPYPSILDFDLIDDASGEIDR